MKDDAISKQCLAKTYQAIRRKTEELCVPLETEDYVIQSCDDVSPPKWHLAHTTWFFETFLLTHYWPKYHLFHPSFPYLFNSYYQQIGSPYPRIKRGLLSRPTVKTISQYRQYVDEHILQCIQRLSAEKLVMFESLLTLGLQHEQQHQELLLMDIKFNFSLDPNVPIYCESPPKEAPHITASSEFIGFKGGMIEIGHHGSGFCFDNELPRHQLFLRPFLVASNLVTNIEYREFIDAGGYNNPRWWLADGWDCVQMNRWQAPLYWHYSKPNWEAFTLNGVQAIDPNEPVAHVSYYEADAYARFRGKRLCLESEWEHCIIANGITKETGHFLESQQFHPRALLSKEQKNAQFFGDLWEWTASPYCPYPGYKPRNDALGEYNGKFMSNQIVLRGGSCITPQSHIRGSYRNFFQPDKRWQFSGIRLAEDV